LRPSPLHGVRASVDSRATRDGTERVIEITVEETLRVLSVAEQPTNRDTTT
jgi:hypothetical protein